MRFMLLTKLVDQNIRTFATAVNNFVDLLPGSGLEFSIDKEAGSLYSGFPVPTSMGKDFF